MLGAIAAITPPEDALVGVFISDEIASPVSGGGLVVGAILVGAALVLRQRRLEARAREADRSVITEAFR